MGGVVPSSGRGGAEAVTDAAVLGGLFAFNLKMETPSSSNELSLAPAVPFAMTTTVVAVLSVVVGSMILSVVTSQ